MHAAHRAGAFIAICALGAAMLGPTGAEEIAVGNYGIAANGMPFAVALEKKLYQQEGANVTGIISSQGGGTSIRNMLAGGVAYGEANPGVTAVAIQQGADLKIVSDNVLTVAEFVWAVKPDSPIQSIKDFKGRKIGYTNPRSTSQALAILLLQAAGLKADDAELDQDRRLRRGRRRARSRPHRRGADGRADLVEIQVEIPRGGGRERHPAAARQRRRRQHRRRHGEQRRFHPRRDPRPPQGGRVHARQPGRGRRHRRQALQPRQGGRPQRSPQSHRQPDPGHSLLGFRASSTSMA